MVTSPEVGITGWGLVEKGKEQAKKVRPFAGLNFLKIEGVLFFFCFLLLHRQVRG